MPTETTAEYIIVTSRKGGVGKSTLSAQAGSALAQLQNDAGVMLVDCDFGVRCLDILCGVSDKVLFDLGDVTAKRTTADKAAVSVRENLSLIASPVSEIPTAEQLTETFAELGKSYAKVILDTPRDSLKAVAQAAKAAAGKYGRVRAIVVMHPHDMALRAAEITGRELEELGIAEKHLVINSFDADAVKKGTRPGIVELIDRASIPLIGVIPYDSDITSAQNDGRLIDSLRSKNAVQAYLNTAKRLNGENIPLFTGFKLRRYRIIHIFTL